MFDVNTSEIAAECLIMFGVCDVAEADRSFFRFVTMHALEGQTDRRTDTQRERQNSHR